MIMDKDKSSLYEYIDKIGSELKSLSDDIWAYAELSLKEHKSALRYIEFLKKEGFHVTENISGMETAFSGSYGSGRPYIGILGEFDALSGLSQEACKTSESPLSPGGCGHGCGHNLLGAAALGAAMAIKKYLSDHPDCSGTVIFYGCPGEEGGSGKAFMARDNIFASLDGAISWHPGDVNKVATGSNQTSMQVRYDFRGTASHAASAPYMGRSALDAVELMNTGVQYLREHMEPGCSIHYAITDAGGLSPNVVQAKASVLYMVRSTNVRSNKKLLARVDDIAKGAALMTGTTLSRDFIDGTSNMISNHVLEKVVYSNMLDIPLPDYTKEEWAFAGELFNTYEKNGLPGIDPSLTPEDTEMITKLSEDGKRPINDFLIPLRDNRSVAFGSNDVGDVSWQTPSVYFYGTTWTSMSPGHSWQNVSMGKHPIAVKGMMWAGKVMAASVLDMIKDPDILKRAGEEWEQSTGEGYCCPIEEDAVPKPIE